MSKNWKIRKATLDDAYGLKLCMDFAFNPYKERIRLLNLPPMDSDYELEISHLPIWVIDYDYKIIGVLILSHEKIHLSISAIAIHPTFQGEGYGKNLIKFAEQRAKSKNYSKITIKLYDLMNNNDDIFKHLGWRKIDNISGKIYMEKQI